MVGLAALVLVAVLAGGSPAGAAMIPEPPEGLLGEEENGAGGGGMGVMTVAAIAVAAAIVALVLGLVLGRAGRSRHGDGAASDSANGGNPDFAATVAPAAMGSSAAAPTPAPMVAPPGMADDRATLVDALIMVVDTATNDGLRRQAVESLAGVGVVPSVVAPGTPFDPHAHRGVQAVAAPTREADNLVAGCDRAGWTDRGVIRRLPEVVVYRWDGP